MICRKCKKEVKEGKFCPFCGGELTMEDSEALLSKKSDIRLCPDGIYRWAYDYKLFKNPTILFVIQKIFAFISLGLFFFLVIISLGDNGFWFEGFFELVKGFAIFFVGMSALAAFGYFVYALFLGGKYCVLFEMDEKGITHTQAPKQFKKAQIVAAITAFTANNPTTLGSSILAGSNMSMSSDWDKVKSIELFPKRNVIKLNGLLIKNQVYMSKEDYPFVSQFILSHCKNAKIK